MKVRTIYIIILAVILITFCVIMYSAFSNIVVHTDSDKAQYPKPYIIIDAGHGGEDGGAEVDGVLEKDINLNISNRLADILRLCGYYVTEIRDEDISVYDAKEADTLREKKVSDLNNRVEAFNSDRDNIVVSIHQNKFGNSAYSGAQIFYSVNNDNSILLAEAVRNSIVQLIQKDNKRELKPSTPDIFILDKAETPAVIVECGFLSNPEERSKLLDESYQNEMAYSIAMGILEYAK